tara:strand:+ start:495 stop:1253 length:759 start_codon:yes stop_codon:yes gene_type:complete
MQEQLGQQPETILPYDMVSLPSQGVFYKSKKKSVKVTYLNASDENLLATPSLQANGELINMLLSRKILDKDINVMDMPECDKEAVLVFLRNTAFGSDYTVTLTDPKTKESFETTIDLSVLKTNEVGVELDNNNEFDHYLEVSKKKVKLSFLTPQHERTLKQIDEQNKNAAVNTYMTKQLEMLIKEIDGVRDPMTIAQFIQTMPIRDSQNIRKVIRENSPSLDLTIPVLTPSNEEINARITFGVEFFRPFYGI